MKTSLSIIIPAYNEQGAIANTIERIQTLGKKESWDLELIVVNDGSTDKTSQTARQLGATVIDHPTNGGYGLSLRHGIQHATRELIAITDADGTYPIEELPKLIAMVDKGYDMAVGARTGTEFKKGVWKYPARIMFRLLAEYVAGRRIPDINSGLRVMRRDKLLMHFEQTCLGFSFTTSITLIFMLKGYFVGYTPIPYAARIGKSKIRHFRDSLRTAQIMISVIVHHNPLKLFLLIAMLTTSISVLSFILGFIFILPSLKVVALILIGSIPVILAIGCLAELIRLSSEK
jgi:glycosyltransferase involved in cell wall biosynthesis